jgi:hypothetical protein
MTNLLNVKGPIQGFQLGQQAMEAAAEGRGRGVATIRDKEFKQRIADTGVNLKETPMAFLGAYTARALGDVVADDTRNLWWSLNHPIAVADKVARLVVDPQGKLPRYVSSAILASVIQPAVALSGAYDPTNVEELGRPKGYKQNIPDPNNFTKSLDPATEVFERFMQGRQGRPLKFSDAKEEIPSLTQGRYANYMKFLYNDPAFLGSVKATSENMQGVPEARVFGYPVSIPSVTAFAGGVLGARAGLKSTARETVIQPSILPNEKPIAVTSQTRPRNQSLRAVAGGLAGSAGGAILGLLANQALAAKQLDSQLPMS